MGQHSDNAVAYFRKNLGRTKGKRKDKVRNTRMLKVCESCGHFPTFFHEVVQDQWILAQYNDKNEIIKHVCKMKALFNVL
jgi:hypothetical protein